MITVTKLPNGKYMAVYEVVNRPSQSNNTAVIYYKFSDNGVTWTANNLGTQIALSDGRGIGSFPYVKWVPTGGLNGTVIEHQNGQYTVQEISAVDKISM